MDRRDRQDRMDRTIVPLVVGVLMNGKGILLVIGASLLILGAGLVYLGQSPHLKAEQNPYAYADATGILESSNRRAKTQEKEKRQMAFGWGLASLVIGAGALVGGFVVKGKQ